MLLSLLLCSTDALTFTLRCYVPPIKLVSVLLLYGLIVRLCVLLGMPYRTGMERMTELMESGPIGQHIVVDIANESVDDYDEKYIILQVEREDGTVRSGCGGCCTALLLLVLVGFKAAC